MNLPLYVHVAGGLVALLAGAAALVLRKGSQAHKRAGYLFVIGMIVMAIPGGIVSYGVGKPFDVLSSMVSGYMVITGWLAFQPTSNRIRLACMAVAFLCFAGYLAVEFAALIWDIRATDAPPGAGYFFATIVGLALVGDFKLSRNAYPRRKALIRHLWRMNFGLFIASGSFFGARPHLFPEWMQTYGVLILLTFAPVLAMAYWRFRLRSKAAQSLTEQSTS